MRFQKCLRFFILVVPPIVLIGISLMGYQQLVSGKKKARKKPQKSIPVVQVEQIHPRDITLVVSGYGKVRSVRRVNIIAEVEGKITQMHPKLKKGNFIQKDDILAQIDPIDYQLRIERLQAQADKWKVRIQNLEQEQKNLQRRNETLRENVKLAALQKRRSKGLKGSGIASHEVADRDHQAYLDKKDRLIEMENREALLPTRIAEAQIELKSIQVQLKEAQQDFARTKVVAPFTGRIVESNIEEGTVVDNNDLIAILADSKAVEVPVMLPKEEFYKIDFPTKEIRAGKNISMPAKILVEISGKQYSWMGNMIRIEPMNQKTHTIPVIIQVDNPWKREQTTFHPILMSGMFCQIEIAGRKLKNMLTIPRKALHENNDIYIIHNSKLIIQQIKIHHFIGDRAVVSEGLKPGDTIVLSSIRFPVPGMKLQIAQDPKQ